MRWDGCRPRMWKTVVQPPRSVMNRAVTDGDATTTQRQQRHPARLVRVNEIQSDGGDLQYL